MMTFSEFISQLKLNSHFAIIIVKNIRKNIFFIECIVIIILVTVSTATWLVPLIQLCINY